MATTTTITKMLLRRGNDSDRKNTILASGEPGFTLDTKRLWIGDGQTPGGYPALSAAEEFFTYDDGVNPCVLRVNVGDQQAMGVDDPPSLTQILASTAGGPDNQVSYFHPTDRDIRTGHNISLMGTRAGGRAFITAAGDLHMHPENGNSNQLILGASSGELQSGTGTRPYIQIQNGVDGGSVRIKCKNFQVTSETSSFVDVESTLFEDPTIDINVQKGSNGATLAPGDNGQSSHSTGIHFAHNNFLSAGNISVGEKGVAGEDSICLTPPEYKQAWATDYDDVRDSTGKSTATDNWVYGDKSYSYKFGNTTYKPGVNMGTYSPTKPLIFRSVRPHEYTGDAHVVMESGLIVYGNDSSNDLNAYRINQHTDTRADVTFKSLNIKDENGDASAIQVSSGGTGATQFTTNSVITTMGNSSNTNALKATELSTGQLLGGSNGGVKVITITNSTGNDNTAGINVTSNGTTGKITLKNTFMPSFLKSNDIDSHYTKYNVIAAENESHEATDEAGEIMFAGGDSWITTNLVKVAGQPKINFTHDNTANFGAWSETTATGNNHKLGHNNTSTVTPKLQGRTINSLTIDAKGHLVGGTVVNQDARYAQINPINADGEALSPSMGPLAGFAVQTNALNTNYTVGTDGRVQENNHASGIVTQNLVSGAYGTASQLHKTNLHDVFMTHKGVSKLIANSEGKDLPVGTWLQLGATGVGDQTFANGSDKKIIFANRPLQFIDQGDDFTLTVQKNVGLKIKKNGGGGHLRYSDSMIHLDTEDVTGINDLNAGITVNHDGFKRSIFKYIGKEKTWSTGNISEHGRLLADLVTEGTQTNNVNYNMPFVKRIITTPDGKTTSASSINTDSSGQFTYNPSTNTLTAGKYSGNISGTTGINSTITTAINTAVGNVDVTPKKVEINNGSALWDQTCYPVWSQHKSSTGTALNTDERFTWDGRFNILEIGTKSGIFMTDGTGSLKVGGEIYAAGALSGKNISCNGTLNVTGKTTTKDVQVNGFVNMTGAMSSPIVNCSGLGTFGSLKSTGEATVGSLKSTGAATVGSLKSTGTATVGSLTSEGTIHCTSNFTTAKDLYVHGKATINSRLTVTNDILGPRVTTSGLITSRGGIDVTTGNLRVAGDITAFHNFSDERLKKDIEPIPSADALNQVLKLQGVNFEWKEESESHRGPQIGLIAQEVEAVVPQVVNDTTRVSDEIQYKTLDYDKLVPLLIESIKELSAKVEKLESQLK